MKNYMCYMVCAALAYTAGAQGDWTIDKAHTSIRFGVTHMVISEVDGEFRTFSGKVTSSKDDFTDAQVEFTLDVDSINTDNPNRDNHLKGDDFFNAEKYPHITFKSTSVKKLEGNKYELEGDLTIRDVTKKVKFDVVYNGTVTDTRGGTHAGFKATTSINRFDYNLKWNSMMDSGPVVGKDVTITVNIELRKQAPK